MSEKICKGCSALVPANRRRCARCGLRVGGVGTGIGILFLASAAVAALLVQDIMDRPNSWVRTPLRIRREQVSGLPSASTSDESGSAKLSSRPSRRAHRTEPRHFTEKPRQRADSLTPSLPADELSAEPEPQPASAPPPSKEAEPAPLSREERWAADFKLPEIGSEVTVRLRGGKEMSGTLLALDETKIEIETPTLTIALSPPQLAPVTRIRFFLADYLRYRELRAAREHGRAPVTASAAQPRQAASEKQDDSDDPFLQSKEMEERQQAPSSGRSPTADAFMNAF